MGLNKFDELETLRKQGYSLRELWDQLLSSPTLLKLLNGNPDNIVNIFPHWKDEFVLLRPIQSIVGLFEFLYEFFQVPDEKRTPTIYPNFPEFCPPPLKIAYEHYFKNLNPPPNAVEKPSKPREIKVQNSQWFYKPRYLREYLEPGPNNKEIFSFMGEAQECWHFYTCPDERNPPVFYDQTPPNGLERLMESLEEFLISMILYQVLIYLPLGYSQRTSSIPFIPQKIWECKGASRYYGSISLFGEKREMFYGPCIFYRKSFDSIIREEILDPP